MFINFVILLLLSMHKCAKVNNIVIVHKPNTLNSVREVALYYELMKMYEVVVKEHLESLSTRSKFNNINISEVDLTKRKESNSTCDSVLNSTNFPLSLIDIAHNILQLFSLDVCNLFKSNDQTKFNEVHEYFKDQTNINYEKAIIESLVKHLNTQNIDPNKMLSNIEQYKSDKKAYPQIKVFLVKKILEGIKNLNLMEELYKKLIESKRTKWLDENNKIPNTTNCFFCLDILADNTNFKKIYDFIFKKLENKSSKTVNICFETYMIEYVLDFFILNREALGKENNNEALEKNLRKIFPNFMVFMNMIKTWLETNSDSNKNLSIEFCIEYDLKEIREAFLFYFVSFENIDNEKIDWLMGNNGLSRFCKIIQSPFLCFNTVLKNFQEVRQNRIQKIKLKQTSCDLIRIIQMKYINNRKNKFS